MKKLLLAALLFSFSFASSSLLLSTLNLTATDQEGNPLPRAEFFLTCKMSFATPERFLCTSGASGICVSACMDCAPGVPATIRARYLNHTIEQKILSWKGVEEGCVAGSPPANEIGIFSFNITEEERGLSASESGGKAEGASENIPPNTTIETKDFRLESNKSREEYLGPSQATGVETAQPCIPAFAFASFLAALSCFRK